MPIDIANHILRIFQGCRQDQGLKEKENGRHLFMGAFCVPKATLRIDDQLVNEGEHDNKVVRTFSLNLEES